MVNLSIFAALVWAFLCYVLVSLFRNYSAAKAIGIPIIISPFDLFHPLWYLLRNLIRPLVFLLPYRLRRWSTIWSIDWPFLDKGRIHREIGDVFALVNPLNFVVIVADPVGAEAVFHRRRDFIKGKNYEIFGFFGSNILAANDEDWARQRRITGPCFNERVSSSVWAESICQARAVLKHWASSTDGVVHSTLDDTKTITLHVLSAAGFGARQDFGHGMADLKPGHTLTYRDALVSVLKNVGLFVVFPMKVFDWPVVPKSMKEAGRAFNEFGSYMDEMLSDERQAIENGEPAPTNPNLLSAMIRSSAEERNPKAKLTDEEIKGNLFIFNAAGHDTTANALAYAISLLSLNQDCQAWLREELEQHVQGQDSSNYEDIFPRLKRCQAIMWETLRLYGPVPSAPRETSGPQTLPLSGGKAVHLPPGTLIHVNGYALQVSPSVWTAKGSGPLDFSPQRWIHNSGTNASEETLIAPQPGTFYAWSSGPRICLGMKFSQVEFVAVISTIFASYIVEPAVAPEKLEAVLAKPDSESPTLAMARSKDVAFRWREIGDNGKLKG